jgi:hypothetical protein
LLVFVVGLLSIVFLSVSHILHIDVEDESNEQTECSCCCVGDLSVWNVDHHLQEDAICNQVSSHHTQSTEDTCLRHGLWLNVVSSNGSSPGT